MTNKHFLAILTILGLTLLILGDSGTVQAQAGTPYEMIAEINNLRAANDLYPLAPNDYLMLSAQNHADWIAETGQGGHIGINGTYAIDRARAVGYGGGAQIWVTENWAMGPGLTVSNCIYVMWDDDAHMGNMLTDWHNEFGVGVALDARGFTIYVVNFGHTSGSPPPQPTQSNTTPGISTPGVTETPGQENTPVPYIQPVTASTPRADGAVIHIVQYGQTLWTIADAYEISLADLLALNGLTEDSTIYTDQELIIVPGSGETTVAETEAAAAKTPDGAPGAVENTPQPTHTPTPTPPAVPTEPIPTQTTPEDNPKVRQNFLINVFSGDTKYIGIGLIAVSVFGLALLLFTSSRLK